MTIAIFDYNQLQSNMISTSWENTWQSSPTLRSTSSDSSEQLEQLDDVFKEDEKEVFKPKKQNSNKVIETKIPNMRQTFYVSLDWINILLRINLIYANTVVVVNF